jgi:serine/threonine-protein kinase
LRKEEQKSNPPAPQEAVALDASALGKLVGLGAASALCALFLWMELVLLRSGGGTFCPTGGRLDCSAIWNGGFASGVQRLTGLPIAAWGLVWSLAAFALALAALLRVAQGRPAATAISAIRLTALAGGVVVPVMLATSLAGGAICLGCLAMDLLVLAYAAIALRRWRAGGLADWRRGATLAAGAASAAFLLLLYPGLRTPRSTGEAGRRAVEAAARPTGDEAGSRGTGNPQRDEALSSFVKSLDPPLQRTLADSLAIYRRSVPQPVPPPRALVGSEVAPVRITEFTDILCEHCASLNETLRLLRESVPPGSYSVDARQFPLDGRCNPLIRAGEGDDVRCVAAKLRLCAEPAGKQPELAAALFEKQKGLTSKTAIEIASRFLSRPQIDACLASPGIRAELERDVAAAGLFDSDGTPIVAINGRKGTSFAPFLYAMILTRGRADHPAFDALPQGDPAAHLH